MLAGGHGVERGAGHAPGGADPPQAVGQTRAGRGGGTHRRDLRRPKGPKVSVLASSSSTCMVNSPDPLHGAIQFRLHRIALALLERGVDPAGRFSHATARAGRSLRPTGATEVAPARHAKAAERPHACAPPSIAGQVPAGLPAKPGLGKTWTSQARPHLPQAHQQQLSSQKLSVMFRSSLDTSIKPILCPRKSGPTQELLLRRRGGGRNSVLAYLDRATGGCVRRKRFYVAAMSTHSVCTRAPIGPDE